MRSDTKQINPIEQPVELATRHRDHRFGSILRPREALLHQSLVPKHEATAFPVQDLHLVAFAVAEDKELGTEGIRR